MATFAQYALAATEEALQDAGWKPEKEEDLESTVSLPVGCAPAKSLTDIRACV